jgi:ubiquitin carboxyl-terminal hydrolase 7
MEEVFDGDIWVIQRTDVTGKFHNTVDDYFRDLNNRISVQFCDKNNPADPGFHVVLNQKMTYNEVAEVVANCIDSEPNLIQFFKPQRLVILSALTSHTLPSVF